MSSASGGLQAVLCVDFWLVVLFGALLADVGIALVAVQDARQPDAASSPRSTVFAEKDTFLSEHSLVMDRSEW